LESHQRRKLEQLLQDAYANVPYYRRVFDERDLRPKDIQCIDDLSKLPFLTKEIVRDNLRELTNARYLRGRLAYVTNGGSTGIPMGFYFDRRLSGPTEWAFISTLWKRVGFRFGDRGESF
jgi:phenylacetate-CoA ligase